MRKVILTSVAIFVDPEEVSNSSVVSLFLLFVGAVNFAIITNSKPYANKIDNFLAGIFGFLELYLFFILIVQSSDIASENNFNLTLMQDLFALLGVE